MTEPLLHLNRLARRLNNVQEEEVPKNGISQLLWSIEKILEKAVKFALFVGVVVIFFYLSFSIRYFPAGLSLADSLFFLLAGLLFGLGYMVLTILGFALALFGRSFWNKFGWVWTSAILYYFVCFVIVTLYCFDMTWRPNVINVCFQLLFFVVGGTGLLYLVEESSGKKRKPNMIFALMLLFVPLFSSNIISNAIIERIAMGSIGIRTMDTSVKLNDENYNILASAVGGQHAAALACDASLGTSGKLVHGINVLWHGVGERTLVEIPDTATSQRGNLNVELKRDGVFVLKNYAGARESCIDLSGELLFKSGSAEIDPANDDELNRVIGIIKQAQPAIAEILVTGHSDPIAYGRNSAKNDALAMQRALAVAARIAEQSCASEGKIKVESKGAREPKTLCKDWPVKKTLAECLVINRRVEIRLKFRQ